MSRTRWASLFSEVRQPDLSRASLDQHAAQGFLQFLDLHRQGRLRDRTGFCRASEMAMTRQRIEIAKLPERQRGSSEYLIAAITKVNLPDGLRCVD